MDFKVLWYRALGSPHGIAIKSNNPETLRARLYTERKAACDPALNDLSIRWSPRDPTEIWIVKKEAQK